MVRVSLSLACALLSSAASAGTAVLSVDRCEEGGSDKYARALREALVRRTGLDVLTDHQTRERLGGTARGSLGDAERQISGSRIDFFQGNVARAERTLEAAIEDLYRLPPSEDRWKALEEAWTLLAQVHQKNGRDEDATAAAMRVLRVAPRYVPNAEVYPPSVRDLFAKVRRRMDGDAQASLSVTVRPTGVPVFVDGKPVGKAPVQLKLQHGTYRVEAGFASGRGIPRQVKVGEVSGVELNEQFEGAVFADRGPCLNTFGGREGRLVALVRLGALLEVDRLFAIREEEPAGGERYLVASEVDVRAGEETREAKVKIYAGGIAPGAIDRLADFLATGEAEPPVLPVRGGVVSQPPQERPQATVQDSVNTPDAPTAVVVEPPVSRSAPPSAAAALQDVRAQPAARSKVPSYLAFGGAAALAGGAAFFGVQASSTDGKLQALRQGGAYGVGTEPLVADLNGQLASQRTTAAVLAGSAVAAATTGAVLWLLSSGEDNP